MAGGRVREGKTLPGVIRCGQGFNRRRPCYYAYDYYCYCDIVIVIVVIVIVIVVVIVIVIL